MHMVFISVNINGASIIVTQDDFLLAAVHVLGVRAVPGDKVLQLQTKVACFSVIREEFVVVQIVKFR